MAKAKVETTYDELMKLAREYGVENNALFRSAAEQYQIQIDTIRMIKDQLASDGSAVSTKEYVRGRENVYANPLIKELPRHTDSANRTLGTMLDVVSKLGHKIESESALATFEKKFK